MLCLGAWGAQASDMDRVSAADPSEDSRTRYYRDWLASVEHLMLDVEYEAFLRLAGDGQRELFLRRFWQARSDQPEGWRNRARERWRRHTEEARRQFGGLESDRARAILLAGKPDQVMALRGCAGRARALEIWSFSPWQLETPEDAAAGFRLLFFLDEEASPPAFRQWSPEDGLGILLRGAPRPAVEDEGAGEGSGGVGRMLATLGAKNCFDFDPQQALIVESALRHALGPAALFHRIRPPIPDPAWLDELAADIEGGAIPALDGSLQLELQGNLNGRAVVKGEVMIPADRIARSPGDHLFDRLVVAGDVWSKGLLVDDFRIEHHLAGNRPQSGAVGLELYRVLAPGNYTFSVRVEDAEGFGIARAVRELVIPELATGGDGRERADVGRVEAGGELARLTARSVAVQTAFPSIELLLSAGSELGGPVVGRTDLRAVTTGGVAAVELLLDSEVVARIEQPPFATRVDFGRLPRRRSLAAVAWDDSGREVARDELVVNGGPHRFAVRLVEPVASAGGPAAGWRARAVVEVPDLRKLERVELFLDETLLATLHQPPFLHPLPAVERRDATFVRAVATLDNGDVREDLVLLTAAGEVDEIDVRAVELYTSVVDPNDRFITGLRPSAFEVFEDGRAQELTRFSAVDRLPIHVALLLDVSGSMAERLEIATASALRFFETVLDPARDRAALLTFNHAVRLRVPFTNDIERLRYGVLDLAAWQATRLYDGVIHASHYFGGIEGKRALVLLSDGEDMGSRFLFKQVLETALRAGVAVYPIAVDLVDPLTRRRLRQLAKETGGSFFSVDRVAQLDEIYRRLEAELRSQYLLVYQAAERRSDRFRTVEVRVAGDLEARTIRGYFP
ncbi:MAG: VWA domain-containing protein [Acidobacteriota bacterium]